MALLVYQQNLITFQAKPLNCWWREPCVSIAVWEYFLPWVGVTTPTYIESLALRLRNKHIKCNQRLWGNWNWINIILLVCCCTAIGIHSSDCISVGYSESILWFTINKYVLLDRPRKPRLIL